MAIKYWYINGVVHIVFRFALGLVYFIPYCLFEGVSARTGILSIFDKRVFVDCSQTSPTKSIISNALYWQYINFSLNFYFFNNGWFSQVFFLFNTALNDSNVGFVPMVVRRTYQSRIVNDNKKGIIHLCWCIVNVTRWIGCLWGLRYQTTQIRGILFISYTRL